MKYLSLIFIVLFSACVSENKESSNKETIENNHTETELYGNAQGTTYSIKYIHIDNEDFQEEIDSLLKQIDKSMSTWVKESLINKINNGGVGEYNVDKLFAEVFKKSQRISTETNGAYDASIAPVIYEWGIGFSSPQKLTKGIVDSLMEYTGNDKFQFRTDKVFKNNKEAKLDFNGIAQGYSVDVIAEFLEENLIDNYMIELGGEVRAKGKNESGEFWRIGIDKPKDENMERELNAIVSLKNKALATSGNYRKFYEVDGERFSHTIDPQTGFPVKHNLLSATVITDECAEADAYATALMVMGVERAVQFLEMKPEVQAYLIFSNKDGSFGEYISPTLKEGIQLLAED